MTADEAGLTPSRLSLQFPATSYDRPIHHAYLHPATMARLRLSCNQTASLTSPPPSSTTLSLKCLVHAWPDATIPLETLQLHPAAAATFAFQSSPSLVLTPIVNAASITTLPAAIELNIQRWLRPVTVQSTLPASVSDAVSASADAAMAAASISRQLWGRSLVAGAFTIVSILSQPHLLYTTSITTSSTTEPTQALITPDTAVHCTTTTASPASLVTPAASLGKPDWSSHVIATFPTESTALQRFLTLRTHTFAPSSASGSALLVCGGSGCGKSALLSVVGVLAGGASGGAGGGVYVRRLTCGEVIASSGAGSERSSVLSDAWDECARVRDRPAVLVMDDLTPLLTTNNFPTLSSQLLTLLDTTTSTPHHPTTPLLIAACDTTHPIAPHWLRAGRFDQQLHVRPMAAGQRRAVLGWLAGWGAGGGLLERVAGRLHGCSVRQVVSVWRYARLLWAEEQLERENQPDCESGSECNADISWKQWETAIQTVAPPTTTSSLLAPSSQTATTLQPSQADPFPFVGGYTALKKLLLLLIQSFLQPHASHTLATFARPTGILLHGPVGCGKSLLLSSLAALAGLAGPGGAVGGLVFGVVWLHVASVLSPYLGESERQLRAVFEQAKANAPCLLLVDDIDALVGSRDDTGGGEEEGGATRLLTTLLVLLDGIDTSHTSNPVLLIATTASPAALDAALLRPGRLSNQLLVGLPGAEDRRLIVERLGGLDGLGGWGGGMDWAEVVRRTCGCSGGELCGLVRESVWLAWRAQRGSADQQQVGRVEMRHLRQAMKAIGCFD